MVNNDLAEIHGLDTFTSQSWTDGRTGTGLSCSDDELDELFLGECVASHDGDYKR